MANLNLSQFTEKTFVADADHTFIWDTVGAISKRVSRNSWLNSGTLTSDAPVTISQTWNGTGSTVFKALVVNATTPGTTSSSSSLLLDLQVGGVSKFGVDKSGAFTFNSLTMYNGGGYIRTSSAIQTDFRMYVGTSVYVGFIAGADTVLERDAANTLALRNGANAQTFNVYGTYTSGTSYERLTLSAPSAANAIIGTNKGSGGGTVRGLEFQTDGVSRWSISTAGHLLGATDNSFNIGATGANRPQNIFVAQTVRANAFQLNGLSHVYSTVNGNIGLYDNALTAFNLLQFGGTSATYPAIKRSTTYLQARLADDSAFAPIQGKLTTDTAFTAGAITDTGYIVLYDSAGVAYKVACTPV
jgi:hypothetical protein